MALAYLEQTVLAYRSTRCQCIETAGRDGPALGASGGGRSRRSGSDKGTIQSASNRLRMAANSRRRFASVSG
jgi:hypothetical protein